MSLAAPGLSTASAEGILAPNGALHTSSARVLSIIVWRELVRFRRQPTRIAAAIGTPLMFWAFLAAGFSNVVTATSSGGEAGYGLFLLPGMMTMVALFTAVFSSISVIDDRNEGWLQSVLVSPASRWSVALGKVLGGAILAFLQSAVLLLAPPVWSNWPSLTNLAALLLALALTSLMMTGIGVAFAWKSETTQGFHAVMNLVLLPMWALSGAIFPIEGQSAVLRAIMLANPLTWCSQAMAAPLHGETALAPLAAAVVFAAAALAASVYVVSRPDSRGH